MKLHFQPGHKKEGESKTLEFQKRRKDSRRPSPCKLEVRHSSDQLLGKSTGPEDCALFDGFVDDQFMSFGDPWRVGGGTKKHRLLP